MAYEWELESSDAQKTITAEAIIENADKEQQ